MKIYVIMQNQGEYEDYTQSCFEAYSDLNKCKKRVEYLNNLLHDFLEKYNFKFGYEHKNIDEIIKDHEFCKVYFASWWDIIELNDYFYEEVELI